MKKLSFTVFFAFMFLLSGINVLGFEQTSIDTVKSVTEHASVHVLPSTFMVLPFIILLAMIATGPLFYPHFWEKHYPKVSMLLGLVTVGYYYFVLNDSLSLLHTLSEYLSFIALLASLFVASGGILIHVDRRSTPLLNVMVLLFGAAIANIVGTTGASMLLIRPFIRINKGRIKPYHIIFFIFIVSNVGGALTPIGDPPLFLGFLRGINFFWFIEHSWYIWLPTILMIIAVFYVIDSKNVLEESDHLRYSGKIQFKGLKNLGYLGVILLSVFIDPGVMSWVPSLAPFPLGLREIIMFAVVYLAHKTADKKILHENGFTFGPILEVAFLFVGIFATMIPALQLIAHEAQVLSKDLDAGVFYWGAGGLSAFLDNAPTYLNFLSAELGKFGMNVNDKADVHLFSNTQVLYLQAISISAVFFGAMTYIGNGPNFMVKSISESAGIKMPSFFEYMFKYSIPVLLPIFTIIYFIFYYGKG
ncbi:MAG: sodium:proton antiporter [bacterium]